MPNPKIATRFIIAAICVALCPAAHADTILTLDANFAAPDYAFYTYTDTSGAVQSSIPVGPYIATLNTGGNEVSALLVCFDINAPTDVGTAYSGSVEPVTDFSGAAFTEIMESTYLVNELSVDGGLNAPLDTRGAISFAIWEIMNPSSADSVTPFPSDPAAQPYELQAANAVADGSWTIGDADLYPTWVPDNPSVAQRFAVITVGDAPEPSTLVLVGLGLLAFGLARGWTGAFKPKAGMWPSRHS